MDVDRLDTPVAEQMTTPVRTVEPTLAVAEAARVLWDERIGSLLLEDGAGILTESDVTRGVAVGIEPETTPVRELATTELVTIPADATVQDAVVRMADHDIKKLPVVQQGQLVGILTTADIARGLVPDLDEVIAAFQ
ncbi:cyclic nucleotide-binding/CBS domain-containing protein [Halosegnis sp.]|uniref:CBS domain-containing protein n=1 Tax=Halosegnis sp. TaxID=2864959 RepID=UPI0035D3FBAD